MSHLEEVLLKAKHIRPSAEHEIEILRSVLRGELGTLPQRNSLIRIIKACGPRKYVTAKLFNSLYNMSFSVGSVPGTNLNHPGRSSYQDELEASGVAMRERNNA